AVGSEGGTLEVAVVEYEGGDRLNVPLYRLDQLEPYRAAGNGDAPPPKLHRLGATTWQRQRDKTRAAIRQMAAELLDLYARRQLATGFAFPPDTPWQRELESAFLYEDTPDQRRASEEVTRDMERARPMDRLLGGDVDLLIGTHRLLSRDVRFHDLGLLIVDEEHRFGVRHKERLKALKLAVDVLTLTATPIPRTLHLSLAGLRDLTLLETPPKDRSPVLTFIEPWDDALIEEALARELGRAQLYQLRGRVGRSHRRAYCYLLAPDLVDGEAEERLRVLEHHTELGAGYRIALRDLELRGAGNLLGGEQSGHAQAVGFDVYLRWLQETVDALKGDGAAGTGKGAPPEVVLDRPAHLPDDYVADAAAKLDLYRRLARAERPCEIQTVREELRDRFGPLPDPAQRLLLVSELRALGAQVGLETVLVKGDEARLTFRRDAHPRLAGLTAALDAVQFEAEVRRPVPLDRKSTRLNSSH